MIAGLAHVRLNLQLKVKCHHAQPRRDVFVLTSTESALTLCRRLRFTPPSNPLVAYVTDLHPQMPRSTSTGNPLATERDVWQRSMNQRVRSLAAILEMRSLSEKEVCLNGARTQLSAGTCSQIGMTSTSFITSDNRTKLRAIDDMESSSLTTSALR